MNVIEFADRIDEANELIGVREILQHFDLKMLRRFRNMDPIVLRESLEEPHALAQHAIPGLTLLVFQWGIAKRTPFLEESCAATRDLQQRGISVRVGMEATGYSRWFE